MAMSMVQGMEQPTKPVHSFYHATMRVVLQSDSLRRLAAKFITKLVRRIEDEHKLSSPSFNLSSCWPSDLCPIIHTVLLNDLLYPH